MLIVVARYNENVEWTKEFSKVIIYNKGTPLEKGHYREILLKNVGKEEHSYYKYIYDNYDHLDDYTIFLSGNPFDFSPNIINKLHEYINNKELTIDFKFLNENVYKCNISNCRVHHNLPFIDVYEKIFNEEKESIDFEFGLKSNFIVSRKQIQKKTKNFYLKIVELLESDYSRNEANVIERFHKLIFC